MATTIIANREVFNGLVFLASLNTVLHQESKRRGSTIEMTIWLVNIAWAIHFCTSGSFIVFWCMLLLYICLYMKDSVIKSLLLHHIQVCNGLPRYHLDGHFRNACNIIILHPVAHEKKEAPHATVCADLAMFCDCPEHRFSMHIKALLSKQSQARRQHLGYSLEVHEEFKLCQMGESWIIGNAQGFLEAMN